MLNLAVLSKRFLKIAITAITIAFSYTEEYMNFWIIN